MATLALPKRELFLVGMATKARSHGRRDGRRAHFADRHMTSYALSLRSSRVLAVREAEERPISFGASARDGRTMTFAASARVVRLLVAPDACVGRRQVKRSGFAGGGNARVTSYATDAAERMGTMLEIMRPRRSTANPENGRTRTDAHREQKKERVNSKRQSRSHEYEARTKAFTS